MTRFHRIMAAVSLALLLGGCELPSVSWPWAKSKPAAEAPVATPPVAPPPSVRMDTLFPSSDWHATYTMQDQGKAEVPAGEDWLREGQRIVATQGGVPYVTWLLQDDGLWRVDPRGGGVLLRYLPPQLQDGTVWTQQSGGKEVWFALTENSSACGPWQSAFGVDQCWQLQVINQGEVTTFLFGRGAGVLKADAVNYAVPADSFVKSLKAQKFGTPLSAADRKSVLDKTANAAGQPAAVVAATPEQFRQALQKVTGSGSP